MTMRAAVLHELGATPVVEEFEEPKAGEGEALVEIELAGINPVDIAIASGAFASGPPPVPSVAGLEGVGRVEGTGPLYYFGGAVHPFGSFAPRTKVLKERLVEVPEGTDPAQAVAFGIAGMAGWLGLSWRAQLKPGEKVIVLGASGIVGLVAVQAARALGASSVVAAGRNKEGLARAEAAGATASVQLGGEPENLTERFIEAGDGPSDVVLDTLWGPIAMAALAATGTRGRLIQIGNSAGQVVTKVPAGHLRGQIREIVGHTNGQVPTDIKQGVYQEMCRRQIAGELSVDVEEVPLADLPEAWERQRSSPGCKLVIRP